MYYALLYTTVIIDTNGWLKLGMNYKLEVIILFLNRSFTSVQIETLGG